MKDPFVETLLRQIAGGESAQGIPRTDLREVAAVHEAGHVAFAVREGFPVHEVVIPEVGLAHAAPRAYAEIGTSPRDGRPKPAPAEKLLAATKILLGGAFAELHLYGSAGRGCLEDLVLASTLLRELHVRTVPYAAVLTSMPREVKGLWPAVEALATELRAKSRLDGKRARLLFRRAFPPSSD